LTFFLVDRNVIVNNKMEVDNIETLSNQEIVADSNQETVVETSKIIDSDDESSLDMKFIKFNIKFMILKLID
jgi:hypothetical protein